MATDRIAGDISQSRLAPHASSFAALALSNVKREYPAKLDHVLCDESDLCGPRRLHPSFYGSYDWHSSVHMHWLLARLLHLFPSIPEGDRIAATFDEHFSVENVKAELSYLSRPSSKPFERTYGWAWLLKLQAELVALQGNHPDAVRWSTALQPLAETFTQRYLEFLPQAEFPVRAGTHANSAFGLLFALDYAESLQHRALRKLIATKAHRWFGRDRCYPASYEPGGDDFLSGGLTEAVLMRRLTDGCSYADWWQLFCPTPQELQVWLTPVAVSDRSDPKLAHLDGLNLSRAWCWRALLPDLPAALRPPVSSAIEAHLAASMPHATIGHYAGTHWLASFAMLALTEYHERRED